METGYSRSTTCCFSGYRPHKLPWGANEADPRCVGLKATIRDAVFSAYESGMRRFICGMALGCDTFFCEAVLELKEVYPDAVLEAALPCEGQADGWSARDRERYLSLLERCDAETVISPEYTPYCMMARNRYMINSSSLLISVYDGSYGGTMQTVNYASKEGLRMVLIKPPA